jgi:hypothetical protein
MLKIGNTDHPLSGLDTWYRMIFCEDIMTKEIPLTKNQIALVDDDDYEMLMEHKWQASYHSGDYFVATGSFHIGNTYKTIMMHRKIMNCSDSKLVVDHINHNTLDNRKENLRVCTVMQNCHNQKKYKKSYSKYKGVSYKKDNKTKKFYASIGFNNKLICLGSFLTEEGAALAYDNKAKEIYGEFAYLNFQNT